CVRRNPVQRCTKTSDSIGYPAQCFPNKYLKLCANEQTTKDSALSAMGHSRPNWTVCAMSGLPPVATELRTSRIGSFVPQPDLHEQWEYLPSISQRFCQLLTERRRCRYMLSPVR